MRTENILERFDKWYSDGRPMSSSPSQSRKLLKQYLSIPLTPPTAEEPFQNICEVLKRSGYKTHIPFLPIEQNQPIHILFECPSQYHVRHLAEILHGEANETNFYWRITCCTGEVFVNPDDNLVYFLEPNIGREEIGKTGNRNQQKMIDDLDIIGISILRYFSSVDLEGIDKHRKKVDSKIKNFKVPSLPSDFFRK